MRRGLALVAVLLASLAPAGAADAAQTPSPWPDELGIGSAPNAIRFGGSDRFQTALAMALALRGEGQYPFDSPDRTLGGAAGLADASGWWGASSCPSSAIVVAGDTPADALAAAPLSDPTDRSDQPRLQRVAAADPLFDPVGGFDRVDTGAAPIIVTASARSGARGLSAPARLALSDLAAGGCTTAREAILVGGTAAVPSAVEDELVELGYEEVFRVAGDDRYMTAARVAAALGTEEAPAGEQCVDPVVADGATRMGFHGNAIIEYRPDAQTCQILDRTVVLADGGVGADALAAGWWTSYWQVPVLLVAPDGTLPIATEFALQSMDIDTLVVLGGTGRIPESSVDRAKQLAGAVAGRFAGADRYDTSVVMARVFGGWYDTDDAADAKGDRVCVAASSGGANGRGWPDALAAGPFCGRLAATQQSSPARVLEPVEDASGPVERVTPAHDAVPVLLVPPGAPSPTESVSELLSGSFPRAGNWCFGGPSQSCRTPGFAIGFGGSATVTDAMLSAFSVLLNGGDDAQTTVTPRLVSAFRTDLDLNPMFRGASSGAKACIERDDATDLRWVAAYADAERTAFVDALDRVTDLDRGTALGAFCVGWPGAQSAVTTLVGVSAAGAATPPLALRSAAPDGHTSMSRPAEGRATETSGAPGPSTGGGAVSTWRFATESTGVVLTDAGQSTPITAGGVELVLSRDAPGTVGRFAAEVDLGSGVTARASGQALLQGDRWELAGRVTLRGGDGGFRASVLTFDTDEGTDDVLFFQLDAFAS